MKMSKLLCGWMLGVLLAGPVLLRAQDKALPSLSPEGSLDGSRELCTYKLQPDTFVVKVHLPSAFKGTRPSRIDDPANVLSPVWERLAEIESGRSGDTLRILHIGDSHVRGHIFPQTAGEELTAAFGAVNYVDMGVNGATCLTFTHPDRIAAIAEFKPGLIILSFGTNESHNRKYNSTIHYHQMDELVKLLRANLPEVPMLLTTPPGSYDSFRVSRRKRTYAINPRTAVAAKTIGRYAAEHDLAVWDMYNVVGGSQHACNNWTAAGLMRPDHVHYLPQGYVLQGKLLFEALITAYNEYVSD